MADDGLIHPHQLLAYVGADSNALSYPISFGSTTVRLPVTPAEVTLAMILAAGFLILPAGSLLIGLAAVIVATADRAIERRQLDTNLLALGIPATTRIHS